MSESRSLGDLPAMSEQRGSFIRVVGSVRRTVAAVIFLLLACIAAAEPTPAPVPDGMPFGHVNSEAIERLCAFALKSGFDLKTEIERVYRSNGADEDALGRVFMFSRQFNTLDANARSYGQLIFSSALNIGEQIGPAYAKIIRRQPADVQQRIRDFLFYALVRHTPKERWEEALRDIQQGDPTLFPPGFQFAHDDPLFANER